MAAARNAARSRDRSDQACHRLALMFGFLAGVKNVPVTADACQAMAAEAIGKLDAASQAAILKEICDEDLQAWIIALADYRFDWIGAARLTRVFFGIDVLGEEADRFFRPVIAKVLERRKERSPPPLSTLHWPEPAWIEAHALRCAGPSGKFKSRRAAEAALLLVVENELTLEPGRLPPCRD